MRPKILLPALLFAAGLAGCDSILATDPVDQLPADQAVTTPSGARAALAGAYNSLESLSYYGGDFLFLNDLSSDNAVHSGTFQSYDDADANQLLADNATVKDIWDAIYSGVNRANAVLKYVPAIAGLDADEKDQILGEAYFLRALNYHNLVKLWGAVPVRTEPSTSVAEASQIARTPVDSVYSLIINDLKQAEQKMSAGGPATRASLGAARALLARVYLYRGDWANAEARALQVEGMGYALAGDYGDLFSGTGTRTSEDIFRVAFTLQAYNYLGYYYLGEDEGGLQELSPSQDIIDDYEPGDARAAWSISGDSEGDAFVTKFPTTGGAEHPHVIRLAEVILIRAEALARLNRLGDAVDEYNRVRVRAGVPEHELGVDVTTQQEVLDAIWNERRRELAFEGDRWADLVRTGRAVSVMHIPAFQALYPIPQSELDVAPNLTQNPGY